MDCVCVYGKKDKEFLDFDNVFVDMFLVFNGDDKVIWLNMGIVSEEYCFILMS